MSYILYTTKKGNKGIITWDDNYNAIAKKNSIYWYGRGKPKIKTVAKVTKMREKVIENLRELMKKGEIIYIEEVFE